MKIKCSFCGTEYLLKKRTKQILECAVCGYRWKLQNKNSFLIFIVMICSLLSVIIFVFTIFVSHKVNDRKANNLTYKITEVKVIKEDLIYNMIVKGYIINETKYIYGGPHVNIKLLDKNKKVIRTQKFMPVSTLIDSNSKKEFSYKVLNWTEDVKSIKLELQEYK